MSDHIEIWNVKDTVMQIITKKYDRVIHGVDTYMRTVAKLLRTVIER